jgi:hypothetical protein
MSNTTVISFYPGGCGNRYMKYLLGNEFETRGIAYDSSYSDKYRYLIGVNQPELILHRQYTLTHCLNKDKICQIFGNVPIIVIKSDFKQSLKREWLINGQYGYHDRKINNEPEKELLECYSANKDSLWPECQTIEQFSLLPDKYQQEIQQKYKENQEFSKISSAWSTIVWHHNYYDQFPVDTTDCKIIDITNPTDYVTTVLSNEINHYHDPIFDFCWNVFETYGPTAPIINLYNQQYN